MANAVGDIIQLVATGVAAGQETQNVYFYRTVAAGSDDAYLSILATELDNVILSKVAESIANNTAFTTIVAKNLTNGLDYAIEPISTPGLGVTSPFSPQSTFTIKLLRETLLTRNGSKRYSGLLEASVGVDGSIVWPAVYKSDLEIAHWQNLIPALEGSGIFEPVIVGRVTAAGETYGDLDLTKINRIVGAQAGLIVSSQNSRKRPQQY